MGATTRDARYGWELFKQSGYALSLNDINDHLRRTGFRQISPRMFQHYHKLFRYGYEEYLPINQLDVRTLQNPIWDAAVRNRYAFHEISVDVDLRLIHRKRLLTFRGLATRISDAVVVVRLGGTEAEEVAAAKIRARDQRVEVVFRQSGEIVAGTIESIYAETHNDLVVFRIGLSNSGSLERLAIRRPLGTRRLRVEIQPRTDNVYLAELVQSLYWLFQAVEAARAAGDEILVELDEGNVFTLPAARVQSLSMRSPLQVELILSAPAILLVLSFVRRLIRIRNEFLEGNVTKEEVEVRRATARKTNAEARTQEAQAKRLEWDNQQREAAAALDADVVLAQTAQLIKALLEEEGASTGATTAVGEKVLNVLEGQLKPALLSLVEAAGDADINFETDLELDDDAESA